LRAAVDTEIEMKWDKLTQSGLATVTKQRDAPTDGVFAFKLGEIDIDLRDGSPVTSCVVVPMDSDAATTPTKRISKAAQTALRALEKAIGESGTLSPDSEHIPAGASVVSYDVWREYAYREGISTGKVRAKQRPSKAHLNS